MAFKLHATPGATAVVNKQYLFPIVEAGPGRQFMYVTADAHTTVDGSGYIDLANKATQGDQPQKALNMLRHGDLIWVYTVASISDARNIEADMKAGVTSIALLAVLDNNGTWIDLSADLLAGTVTYGD